MRLIEFAVFLATPTANPHLSADRTEAIILSAEPLVRAQRKRVAEFAAQRRLPLVLHSATLVARRDRCVRYIDRMRRLR